MTLDEFLDSREDEIDSSLEEVTTTLILLLAALKVSSSSGRFDLSRTNTELANEIRSSISEAFAPFRKTALKVSNLSRAFKETRLSLLEIDSQDVSFSPSDEELVTNLASATRKELNGLTRQTEALLGALILSSVLSGSKRSSLVRQIRQNLVGGTDVSGRPLAQYAKTVFETRFMEAFSTLMLNKSKELGVKYWRYSGGLVKDSRPWCVEHDGQVLSFKEILDWEKSDWKGKKAGNPFVTRGGWNCRHYWTAWPSKNQNP